MATTAATPNPTTSAPLAPQLKAFQAGREDVLNAFNYYFGPPAHPQLLDHYTEHHAATLHFPDAYKGTSVRIRDTITNLITENVQNFLTTVIAPWRRQDNPNISWDEHVFDVRMLQPVPYEGVSRNQTSLSRSHAGKMTRRGIGLILESDFFATEKGKQAFAEHLVAIQMSVQETENYDVMFALLTTDNMAFKYEMDRGLVPRRHLVLALKDECAQFAITQKDGRGFERMIEATKQKMGLYHVSPNSLIMAPQMSMYLTMGPEERIRYDLVGPEGPARFNAGPNALESGTVRGLKVYEVKPFDVGEASREAIQMLSRSVQVGEYYVAGAPEHWARGQPLDPEAGDVVLYDEHKDSHVRITLERALMHCLMPEVYTHLKANSNGATYLDEDALDMLNFRSLYNVKGSTGLRSQAYDWTRETLDVRLPDLGKLGFDSGAGLASNVLRLLLDSSGQTLFTTATKTKVDLTGGGNAADQKPFSDLKVTDVGSPGSAQSPGYVEKSLLIAGGHFVVPKPGGGTTKMTDLDSQRYEEVAANAPENPFGSPLLLDKKLGTVYINVEGRANAGQDTIPRVLVPFALNDGVCEANDAINGRTVAAAARSSEYTKRFLFWMRHFIYSETYIDPTGKHDSKHFGGHMNLRRLAVALRCGVWLPVEVNIARPFIEHRMLSAIACVAGSETANTFFGLADMQVSADTSTKVIHGHFTCHTKAIVTNPRNIHVIDNVFSDEYVAGCNTAFFGENYSEQAHPYAGAGSRAAAPHTARELKPVASPQVRTSIANRLSFQLDFTEARNSVYESMLCMIVPWGSTAAMSEPAYNLTSRHLPWEVGSVNFDHKQFPGGHRIFQAYNTLLALDQIILAGEDTNARQQRLYMHAGSMNNGVCIVGPSRRWSHLTKNFTLEVTGQGHWGEKALRGDAKVRRGDCLSFSQARAAAGYGSPETDEKNIFYSAH